MYQRILVPLDGSELARQVIPHVTQFARSFGSEVIVINVCEPEDTAAGQVCRVYIQNEVQEVQKAITGSRSHARGEVLNGMADEQVLSYAHGARVDLIFMASHGRSGAKHALLGSTANKILHKTGVPLVVIRAVDAKAEPGALFRRILVPLDGSETGAKVLPHVAAIAGKLESEVILLRVVETGKHVHTFGGLNYVPYKHEDLAAARKSATEYLQKIKVELKDVRTVTTEVGAGDAAAEIIKLAAKKECTLVALSSHGHSKVEAWAIGSVTYKVLQTANRSVLFVPAFGA